MNILVIGCGSIGSRHAANLKAFPGLDIHVYDSDPKKSEALAKQHSVEQAIDLGSAFASNPDAVLVCTPSNSHIEIGLKSIEAGAHVFIEKPISNSVDNIDALIANAKAKSLCVLVGCNMRFHRPIEILKRWCDKGLIGRPLHGSFYFGNYLPNWREVDYRKTYNAVAECGGIVLDGIHEIDYAQWFLGEVKHVAAMTGKVSSLDIQTEDVADLLLKFDTNCMASVHLDYLRRRRGRSCEIIGEEGLAIWRAEGKDPEHSIIELCTQSGTKELLTIEVDLNEMYVKEMRHFMECISGKEKPLLDAEQAKRVLEVALEANKMASQYAI